MANPFLTDNEFMARDTQTALLLEKAMVMDIKNATAYTDGNRIFINTEENLEKILPLYNLKMLKWLLWHEYYHIQLRHSQRYFKYIEKLKESELEDKFHLAHNDVNIIMDILVHDIMCKTFPELVETAIINLAQMRNRNSLGYTFKTYTLEEMLSEYAEHKKGKDSEESTEDKDKEESKEEENEDTPCNTSDAKSPKDTPTDEHDTSKGHGTTPETPEVKEETETSNEEGDHDKTDWSKLEDIDSKEFLTKDEGDDYEEIINKLKTQKLRLAKLTETLNGLVTSTRTRTYTMPSTTHVGSGVLMKGSIPGRTKLYLCFDASGSMGRQLATFKDIISKSIPQAMDTPTAWFSGYGEKIKSDPDGKDYDYYKGTFKDIMPVYADCGYGDDGDRTIELCWKAEQEGYTPIGVTDGGGRLTWSKDMLKQLKNTILVGQCSRWLKEVQKVNPKIKILSI